MIQQSKSVARRALNRVLAPMSARIEAQQQHVDALHREYETLAARIEQLSRSNDRLVAHLDRFREEIRAEFGEVVDIAAGARSIVSAIAPDGEPHLAGAVLVDRLDSLCESVERVTRMELGVNRSIAEVRSSMRLTQAMVERFVPTDAPGGGSAPVDGDDTTPAPRPVVQPASAGPVVEYAHPVPSFDLIYRTFENRHRGTLETIQERQEADYLELLSKLPSDELPIVDLGCGRGELVEMLGTAGQRALGVDSNLGQLVGRSGAELVQGDLFDWLDARPDSSVRAITSLHVVEHLPLDLQVRLVFEARRVLVEGGLLILETPNTLSLSVAASNFWVDPTHQRPVHPLFLELLAEEAGFAEVETRLLHETGVSFRGSDVTPDLVDDLNSLILGAGDLALVARR
jgi:SAM-dependent methyltransferase